MLLLLYSWHRNTIFWSCLGIFLTWRTGTASWWTRRMSRTLLSTSSWAGAVTALALQPPYIHFYKTQSNHSYWYQYLSDLLCFVFTFHSTHFQYRTLQHRKFRHRKLFYGYKKTRGIDRIFCCWFGICILRARVAKTAVIDNSLNPKWDETFRIEVRITIAWAIKDLVYG